MAIAGLQHLEPVPELKHEESILSPTTSRSTVSHICVAVRCRPPLDVTEQTEGAAVSFPSQHRLLVKHNGDEHMHKFDHVFGPESSQETIFRTLGAQLLEKAMQGFDNTVFAYGQTGSGKTFTMMNMNVQPEARGFFPRLGLALFERISVLTQAQQTRRFQVECSLLEIYNEIIYDLLAPRHREHKRGGLEVKEQKGIGVYVCGLTEAVVKDPEGLTAIVSDGLENRATGPTRMNDASSRSHCVLTLKLRYKDSEDGSKNFVSKVNLVDLAGSERVAVEDADGKRAVEGANINKSLSALGNVITTLSSMAEGQKKTFVPYRNSKLTRVLQESLGGNALCTMIATICPSASTIDDTLATLRFARHAKGVQIEATKNLEVAQVVRLQQEIEALKGNNAEKHKEEIELLQSYMKESWEDRQRLSEQVENEREKAKEEAMRAQTHLKLQQKRRLQMLEQHGDLTLTLKEVTSLNSKFCGGWLDRFGAAIKVGEQLRTELRALKIFREGVGTDLMNLWNYHETDATAARVLVGPVQKKLASLSSELDVLIGINNQLEAQMGSIVPELTLALHTARNASSAGEASHEDLVELLALMLRQYEDHYSKERALLRQEVLQMNLSEDLQQLHERLSERPLQDLGLEDDEDELDELLDDLQEKLFPLQRVAGKRASLGSLHVDLDLENTCALPAALGICLIGDAEHCLSASSNATQAKSARLLNPLGGWTPATDGPDEYLEIDLGSADGKVVAGLSLQGRSPCSGAWQHTREMLRLVLGSSESTILNAPEGTFTRPPVRFVYDIAVTLVQRHQCFGEEHMLQIPTFTDMSREEKSSFFMHLIEKVKTVARAGDASLKVTPQDILSGKNCVETNRLLQLMCCLSLRSSKSSDSSRLGGAVAQWTTFWKLRYLDSNGSWHWYGAHADNSAVSATVFEGCSDADSVKFVRLPEDVVATKLRIHPEEWHNQAALRCEVHVLEVEGAQWWQAFDCLKTSVGLMIQGITKLQERVESREIAVSDTLKRHAEEERGELEQRLQDASKRAEVAENVLLKVRAENERLMSHNKKLKKDLAIAEKAQETLESVGQGLKQERDEMQSYAEELGEQISVLAEERDFARAREEELFYIINTKDEELLEARQRYMEITQKMRVKELESDLCDVADGLGINEELLAQNAEDSERCLQLQAKVNQLLADSKAREAELKKMQKKKEKLKKENEQLLQDLEVSEQKRLEAKDKIVKLLERQEQLKADRKKILNGNGNASNMSWTDSPVGSTVGSARNVGGSENLAQGAPSRLLRRSSSVCSSSSVVEPPRTQVGYSTSSSSLGGATFSDRARAQSSNLLSPEQKSPERSTSKRCHTSPDHTDADLFSHRSVGSSTRDTAHSSRGWVAAEQEMSSKTKLSSPQDDRHVRVSA